MQNVSRGDAVDELVIATGPEPVIPLTFGLARFLIFQYNDLTDARQTKEILKRLDCRPKLQLFLTTGGYSGLTWVLI